MLSGPGNIGLAILFGQLFLAWPGLCMTVKLSYSATDITGAAMPDIINITLTTGLNESLILTMKKVGHMSVSIPLHTLVLGPDGLFVTQQETVGDTENTAFYQDLTNDAVMEVKRIREDDALQLNFKGQFRYNDSLLTVSHVTRAKRDVAQEGDIYDLQIQPKRLPVYDIGIQPPGVPLAQSQADEAPLLSEARNLTLRWLRRMRRQTNPIYYIDVVAVVDFGAYSRFLASSVDRAAALQSLLEYYTFVVTGVDLLYQGITTTSYRIRVRLVKVVVAESAAVSRFTELFRQANSPYDTVDAYSGLSAFQGFVSGAGSGAVTPYDHAMLFTGLDLTSGNSKSILGLAYVGTLCTPEGYSTSIVEDLGGFTCVYTAAHELGHSISARHDGVSNTCNGNDGFIMAAIFSATTEATKLNPWKFSSCSVQYFTDLTTSLLTTPSGASCLLGTLDADPSVPDVGESLPGLKYSANEQCKMLQGSSSSFLCAEVQTVSLVTDPSLICTKMYCYIPGSSLCRLYSAARGTVCGDGKLCLSGECVAHPSAPHVDETCMFGDSPFINCADITKTPWRCYSYSKTCCASCKAHYRPVQGCEYGDRDLTCTASDCRIVYNLPICCASCNYGTPITTSSTTPSTTSTSRTTYTTTISTPTTTTKATTTTTSTTTSKPTTTISTPTATTSKPTTTTTSTTTKATTTTTLTTTSKPTKTTISTPTTTTKLTVATTPKTTTKLGVT